METQLFHNHIVWKAELADDVTITCSIREFHLIMFWIIYSYYRMPQSTSAMEDSE